MEENKVENVINIIKDMDIKINKDLEYVYLIVVGLIFYMIKQKCMRNLILY